MKDPVKIYLEDDGIFPNSHLPTLLYKGILKIPFLFPALHIIRTFKGNNWSNSWDSGIFTYHHYHSITHEVLGVYSGKTILQLGGKSGKNVTIEKGDVLIIPAGVAHKNLGGEHDVKCIGAYPKGMDYDMNYGKQGERPLTDENIKAAPLPLTDPIYGKENGLTDIWKK